jgi:hypothetical protein
METFLLAFAVGLVIFLIKLVIDLYGLISIVKKEKEIVLQKNVLENKYQFIKGLF